MFAPKWICEAPRFQCFKSCAFNTTVFGLWLWQVIFATGSRKLHFFTHFKTPNVLTNAFLHLKKKTDSFWISYQTTNIPSSYRGCRMAMVLSFTRKRHSPMRYFLDISKQVNSQASRGNWIDGDLAVLQGVQKPEHTFINCSAAINQKWCYRWQAIRVTKRKHRPQQVVLCYRHQWWCQQHQGPCRSTCRKLKWRC